MDDRYVWFHIKSYWSFRRWQCQYVQQKWRKLRIEIATGDIRPLVSKGEGNHLRCCSDIATFLVWNVPSSAGANTTRALHLLGSSPWGWRCSGNVILGHSYPSDNTNCKNHPPKYIVCQVTAFLLFLRLLWHLESKK